MDASGQRDHTLGETPHMALVGKVTAFSPSRSSSPKHTVRRVFTRVTTGKGKDPVGHLLCSHPFLMQDSCTQMM